MLETINDSKATMNVHSITSSPQPEGQIDRSHLPLSILVENWDRVQDLIEEKGDLGKIICEKAGQWNFRQFSWSLANHYIDLVGFGKFVTDHHHWLVGNCCLPISFGSARRSMPVGVFGDLKVQNSSSKVLTNVWTKVGQQPVKPTAYAHGSFLQVNPHMKNQ